MALTDGCQANLCKPRAGPGRVNKRCPVLLLQYIRASVVAFSWVNPNSRCVAIHIYLARVARAESYDAAISVRLSLLSISFMTNVLLMEELLMHACIPSYTPKVIILTIRLSETPKLTEKHIV